MVLQIARTSRSRKKVQKVECALLEGSWGFGEQTVCKCGLVLDKMDGHAVFVTGRVPVVVVGSVIVKSAGFPLALGHGLRWTFMERGSATLSVGWSAPVDVVCAPQSLVVWVSGWMCSLPVESELGPASRCRRRRPVACEVGEVVARGRGRSAILSVSLSERAQGWRGVVSWCDRVVGGCLVSAVVW